MIVRARNFLSWAELTFKVAQGVTLVKGFNHDDGTPEGSGKSAILNAISWGFFGCIPKDANIDDVIREGASSCSVEIELPEFTVVRTRKPNDLHILYKGGKVHRGKDARETQKDIERLLGMSFETFCQSIYYAQNYPNKFVTANQENKGKILSEILDLEQFDRARKVAADRAKKVQFQLTEATRCADIYASKQQSESSEIASYEELIEKFHEDKAEKIRDMFSKIKGLEEEAEAFVAEFEETQKRDLKAAKAELKELDEESSKLQNSLNELEEALNDQETVTLEEQKEQAEGRLEALSAEQTDLKAKAINISELEKAHVMRQAELKRADQDHTTLLQRLKNKALVLEEAEENLAQAKKAFDAATAALENPAKENCPTCGQAWDGDSAHFETEVLKAKQQLDRDSKHLKQVQEDIKDTEKQRDAAKKNIERLKKAVEEFELPSTDHLEHQIRKITAQIDEAKAEVKVISKKMTDIQLRQMQLKSLREKQNSLQKQRDRLQTEIEKIKERTPLKTLEGYEKRIQDLGNAIEAEDAKAPTLLEQKLNDTKAKLQQTEKDLKRFSKEKANAEIKLAQLEALRDGYKEVKAYTFQATLNLLSKKANAYLTELFEQPVKITFKNVDMKIDVSVSIDGKDRAIGLYSGGQFRRIALAVDLALSDITLSRKNNKLNLIIMDEYCKDLSEVSMEKVLHLLQSRKGSTILIEHNSIFNSIVNQTFEVELIDGVSREVA